MQCADALRVQAYFDAQLDAASSLDMERHLERCVECGALLHDLQYLRSELRRHLPVERAPGELRARVLEALEQENARGLRSSTPRHGLRLPPFWSGALTGLGGAAAAALVVWFLVVHVTADVLVDRLVSAHVHSLLPGRLVAVTSTDRHTVKPWFAGHADVSPAVADFVAQGYKLLGGRSDAIDGQRAAVVVYQHGAHTINVFSWAADRHVATPGTTRSGYHLDFWTVGNLQYCAISDTGWDELQGLAGLLRDLAAREEHPPTE